MQLRINIGWMLIGNSAFAACQWLFLIILSKYYGSHAAGAYALSQAFIYPVFAITNMQIARLQATEAENGMPFRPYFLFSFVSSFLGSILAISLFLLTGHRTRETLLVFVILTLAKCLDTLSDACYGDLLRREFMRPIAISLSIRNSLALVCFVSMILIEAPLWLVCITIPMSWLLVFILFDLRLALPKLLKHQSTLLTSSQLMTIVRLGLPLTGVIFLNQLFLSAPRVTLEHFHGLDALGFFAPLASLITLGGLIVNATSSALLPRFSRLYKARNYHDFNRLAIVFLLAVTALGSAIVFLGYKFGMDLNKLLFSESTYENHQVLILISIAAMFWYLSAATGTFLTAARVFKFQLYVSIALIIVTGMTALLLIPSYAAIGASYALIAGSVVKFICQLFIYMGLTKVDEENL